MPIKPAITPKSAAFSRAIGLATLLLAFQMLASCTQPAEPVLRVATNVWPGYEPLYLARSLGLYDKSPIRLVEMPSTSQTLHALSNGTVEAAALTLDEALNQLQAANGALRVLLVMDISNGADALLAREDIADTHALRGKRVGVENTATGAVVLDAALESAKLTAEDIQIVPMTVNDHLSAWNRHDVDALVTFEPIRSQLLNAGAHELFNSSQIPGRILDVLVVRADAIDQHRATLKTLVAGYFSAHAHILHNPQDAALRMAPRLKTEPSQVMSLFNGLKLPDLAENRQWLSGSDAKLQQAAAELAKLMREHQLLQFDISVDGMADAEFLPESAP